MPSALQSSAVFPRAKASGCAKVGHELVMVGHSFPRKLHGVLGCSETNEIRWNRTALVHQLVERMLPICARFTKVDGTGCCGTFCAIHLNPLSIAFHVQLLDVCNKPHKRLTIW